MPELDYANPALLVPFTPGETSPNQAVPNYYYIDLNPDTFALRDIYDVNVDFWDSVADRLRVGNKITCVGHGGADPYPLAITTATIIVKSIEPAPLGSKYPHRVGRNIGPESFFMTESADPAQTLISMISGEECAYRGVVQLNIVAGPTATFNIEQNVLGTHINLSCLACGVLLSNNTTNVGNLSIASVRPLALGGGEVVFELVWVTGAAPTGNQTVLLKLEVYQPISNFT